MTGPDYPFSPTRLWLVALAGFWISVVFLLAPDIDRRVSGLVSTPEAGFFWAGHWLGLLVRDLVVVSVAAVAVLALATLLGKLAAPRRTPLLTIQTSLYLLSCLILVPGLLVNAVLKDHWGRPRPVHLAEFQDPPSGPDGAVFQPIWLISDQCAANCSFVSGEASAGFVMVALVPLVVAHRRRAALVVALCWGAIVSAARVVQGGHFLSDVLLAGVLTVLAVGGLYWAILRRPPGWLREPALTDRLIRARCRLTGAFAQVWTRLLQPR